MPLVWDHVAGATMSATVKLSSWPNWSSQTISATGDADSELLVT
jgi:hypothetical protein